MHQLLISRLALLASLCVHVATTAGATEFSQVQPEKSRFTFIFKQMGVPVTGVFPKVAAQVAFDPAKPESGKVNISIDLASVDAGSKDANDEIVGREWFNTRLFPKATFSSTHLKSLGAGKYEVAGQLAIKGKSQPVTAPFTFSADGNQGVFEGRFTVKRIDFAIGEGAWADVSTVANDVQVNFRVIATAASPVPASKPAAEPNSASSTTATSARKSN